MKEILPCELNLDTACIELLWNIALSVHRLHQCRK